jgi:hypothetical protein
MYIAKYIFLRTLLQLFHLKIYKENSPVGELLSEDRGVVALMRDRKVETSTRSFYFPISQKKTRRLTSRQAENS